jgi:MFS family permease
MASTTFAPFRSRRYALIWTGSLISNIGTWMETVALGFYVADTTGKNSWSAIVAAAAFIANGILGPVGSAMADRMNRRLVIVVGNAVAGVVAALVAFLVMTDNAPPGVLALLAFISGAAFAFSFPSFQTVIPELVPREHLVAAVGLGNAGWNLGRVLGPAAAALALWLGGVSAALWINACSFLAVIAAVLLARVSTRRGGKRPVFEALGDGLRFARTTPAMRRMLALMVPTVLVAAPFIAFVAQMATNVLGGGEGATSVLTTAQGVGAVVAAVLLGRMTARLGSQRLLVLATFGVCAALVLYGAAPSVAVAALGMLALGVTYGFAFTSFSSIAQQSAPDEMRGRVLAVNSFVLGIGYPVGVIVQGVLADVVGLRPVTIGSGVVLAVAAVAVAILGGSADGNRRQIRRASDGTSVSEQAPASN